MRRSATLLLGLALLASAGGAPTSASAGPGNSVDELLAGARSDRKAATEAVRLLEVQVDALTTAYGKAERRLQGMALKVLAAYRDRLILSAQLAEAQDFLDGQAASAYEAGPALPLELMLGSRSPADIASVQEFAARAIGLGSEAVDRVKALRAEMGGVSTDLQRRQDELAGTAAELQKVALRATDQLTKARDVAAAAGLKVSGAEGASAQAGPGASALRFDHRRVGRRPARSGSEPAARAAGAEPGPGLRDPHRTRRHRPADRRDRFVVRTGIRRPPDGHRSHLRSTPVHRGQQGAAAEHVPSRPFQRAVRRGAGERPRPVRPRPVFDLSQATAEYLGLALGPVTADVLIPI